MTTKPTLIAFDSETSGTNTKKDRIVTFNITIRDLETGEQSVHDWLINPGVTIPDGAIAVHGITNEHAQEHGEDPREALDSIAELLAYEYDQGGYLVAFNISFDLPLLENELARYGLPSLEERIDGPLLRVYDPLVIDRAADKYRKGKRTLVAMCPVYGIEPSENAHDAAADVAMTLDLMEALLNTYNLPKDDRDLYAFQKDAHRIWAEGFGRYLHRQGKEDNVDRNWI